MTDFHFIRPWWLLALVLIALIAYLLKHLRVSQSGWQQVIPAHLVTTLLSGEHQKQKHSILLPCFIALITILALAGPAWQKLPQPVYNVKKGAVVILDLSTSMYATDLAPNRLTRARFKVLDLLDKLNEGDVGLIAYAGDSFVISPLTEDINNIKLLLPELAPNIMPVQGSNPLLALTMADDMLKNAGHIKGDIFWLTDEADQYDVEEISSFFTKIKHHINILGVGTQNGAPIKLPNGQLLKDNSGSIVVPQLTSSALELLANKGRGTYKTLTNSANDINTLLASSLHSFSNGEQQHNTKNSNNRARDIPEENQNSTTSDTYQDMGPYLLLLIIPLLLPYFRRGSLMALIPCCLWFSQVPESYAQQVVSGAKLDNTVNAPSNNNSEASSGTNAWKNLWQTQNQQAQAHYQNENYQQAAEQFSDSMWQGSAHYKNGNFAEALAAFEQEDSAQALYNQGNSLAKLGQLEEAIAAYDNALVKNPNLPEVLANKQAVEKVLEQQKQQQNQEGDKSGEKSDESSDENSDKSSEQSNSNEQSENSESNNADSENNSEQESSESQSEQNSSENSDDSSEESSEKSSEQSSSDNAKGNESENNEETDQQSSSKNNESEQSQPSEEELAQYKKALEDELKKQAEQSDEKNNEYTASEASAQDDNSATDEEAPQVASLSAEELAAQENEQHKQQLLKKLTDNPALLLRNKMKLEYQKRRQERQSSGVNKQW